MPEKVRGLEVRDQKEIKSIKYFLNTNQKLCFFVKTVPNNDTRKKYS